MANFPAPGDAVPGFELPNQHGELVSLDALHGSSAVLVFYPFAFSRVCTDELDELQQNLEQFQRRGVRVLAISIDHRYALRTYAEERGYEFDLLADFWPHGAVAERYGVLDTSDGYARRTTFFVDPTGCLTSRIEAPLGQGRSFADYSTALRGLPLQAELPQ
ncbi:redoxin domain-containing protein [uncultured Arthrobacter sp.]|uniref:redoxin domain-containing protein n=1 Tax=uncultured Arthrobacter sp. TaxID=114050 RepID=UPI00262AF258|nr:redoxin domain-containing protein [uncultured Arthrobacter sp.]